MCEFETRADMALDTLDTTNSNIHEVQWINVLKPSQDLVTMCDM